MDHLMLAKILILYEHTHATKTCVSCKQRVDCFYTPLAQEQGWRFTARSKANKNTFLFGYACFYLYGKSFSDMFWVHWLDSVLKWWPSPTPRFPRNSRTDLTLIVFEITMFFFSIATGPQLIRTPDLQVLVGEKTKVQMCLLQNYLILPRQRKTILLSRILFLQITPTFKTRP